jgi:hypothetical protein
VAGRRLPVKMAVKIRVLLDIVVISFIINKTCLAISFSIWL